MNFTVEPIAHVCTERQTPVEDFWGASESRIELTDAYPADALLGLTEFSHVEVVFLFHQLNPGNIVIGTRHPRNNPDWPNIGIFAQRGKNRPNRLGLTICKVLRVEGRTLVVGELDAIDGTPVLDIKPVMAEFLPREEVRQPAWSRELMHDYWLREKD